MTSALDEPKVHRSATISAVKEASNRLNDQLPSLLLHSPEYVPFRRASGVACSQEACMAFTDRGDRLRCIVSTGCRLLRNECCDTTTHVAYSLGT